MALDEHLALIELLQSKDGPLLPVCDFAFRQNRAPQRRRVLGTPQDVRWQRSPDDHHLRVPRVPVTSPLVGRAGAASVSAAHVF
ncbi:MAG TPA: hypothetical protein VGI23_00710, partial [Steroidobacteraceae bacterium]